MEPGPAMARSEAALPGRTDRGSGSGSAPLQAPHHSPCMALCSTQAGHAGAGSLLDSEGSCCSQRPLKLWLQDRASPPLL